MNKLYFTRVVEKTRESEREREGERDRERDRERERNERNTIKGRKANVIGISRNEINNN